MTSERVTPPTRKPSAALRTATSSSEQSRVAFEQALARRREEPTADDADSAPALSALPPAAVPPPPPFAARSFDPPAAPASARLAVAALQDVLAAQAAAHAAMPSATGSLDAAMAATPADNQWHVELNQAQTPVRTLDLARGAEGRWQVTLHGTPLAAADSAPGAALQRLRDRLAARGASLQTRTTPFDEPDREQA